MELPGTVLLHLSFCDVSPQFLFGNHTAVALNTHVPCRRIVYNDLQAITPEQYFKQITKRLAEIKAVSVSTASFELLSSGL